MHNVTINNKIYLYDRKTFIKKLAFLTKQIVTFEMPSIGNLRSDIMVELSAISQIILQLR